MWRDNHRDLHAAVPRVDRSPPTSSRSRHSRVESSGLGTTLPFDGIVSGTTPRCRPNRPFASHVERRDGGEGSGLPALEEPPRTAASPAPRLRSRSDLRVRERSRSPAPWTGSSTQPFAGYVSGGVPASETGLAVDVDRGTVARARTVPRCGPRKDALALRSIAHRDAPSATALTLARTLPRS
jgi:hypothetical protein